MSFEIQDLLKICYYSLQVLNFSSNYSGMIWVGEWVLTTTRKLPLWMFYINFWCFVFHMMKTLGTSTLQNIFKFLYKYLTVKVTKSMEMTFFRRQRKKFSVWHFVHLQLLLLSGNISCYSALAGSSVWTTLLMPKYLQNFPKWNSPLDMTGLVFARTEVTATHW